MRACLEGRALQIFLADMTYDRTRVSSQHPRISIFDLVRCTSSLSCDHVHLQRRNPRPPSEPQASIARNTCSFKPFIVARSLLACKLRHVAAGPRFWDGMLSAVLEYPRVPVYKCATLEARVIEYNIRTSGISPFRLGADTYSRTWL